MWRETGGGTGTKLEKNFITTVTNTNINMPFPYTYSRKQLPLPVLDVRTNPSSKLTWDELVQLKREMLQAYQIMISRILSPVKPMDMRELRDKLLHEYYFSNSVIDLLFDFILGNDTKFVMFKEENGCSVSHKIYLKKEEKSTFAVSPSGPYSVFMPNLK
jgi:hypothetical protein